MGWRSSIIYFPMAIVPKPRRDKQGKIVRGKAARARRVPRREKRDKTGKRKLFYPYRRED
jgi:hypothetical protein